MTYAESPRPVSATRPLAVPSLAGALLLLAALEGCQKPLFQDDFAPTALQKEQGGTPPAPILDLDEGTNEDPTVDNPDFPNGGNPMGT